MNDILTGKICPYCGNPTEYVDSSVIYGRSYGMIYLCRNCRAYAGVHKGTNQALGRLANAELREAKKEAAFLFRPNSQDKPYKQDLEEAYPQHI